jgi:hypothetical protein
MNIHIPTWVELTNHITVLQLLGFAVGAVVAGVGLYFMVRAGLRSLHAQPFEWIVNVLYFAFGVALLAVGVGIIVFCYSSLH